MQIAGGDYVNATSGLPQVSDFGSTGAIIDRTGAFLSGAPPTKLLMNMSYMLDLADPTTKRQPFQLAVCKRSTCAAVPQRGERIPLVPEHSLTKGSLRETTTGWVLLGTAGLVCDKETGRDCLPPLNKPVNTEWVVNHVRSNPLLPSALTVTIPLNNPSVAGLLGPHDWNVLYVGDNRQAQPAGEACTVAEPCVFGMSTGSGPQTMFYEPHPLLLSSEPPVVRKWGCIDITIKGRNFANTGSQWLKCQFDKINSTHNQTAPPHDASPADDSFLSDFQSAAAPADSWTVTATYRDNSTIICKVDDFG
eukprot:gene11538-22297_t